MGGATLIITRDETALNFVLQSSQVQNPAIMQAKTKLPSGLRNNISDSLEGFAVCLEGFHADEPRFKQLGQILYRTLLPEAIRIQIEALDGPLTILTDDPTLPWEIMHDDNEFLALRLPIARSLIVHEQMRSLLQSPQFDTDTLSVLIIADPTDDLPGARKEGKELYKFFKGANATCDLLLGEEATWDKILGKLVSQSYSIIHYCGHVDYHPEERQSSIRLQNHRRLYAGSVLQAFEGNPIVFLNACYSDIHLEKGIDSRYRAETLARTEGFAQAFMLGSERGVAKAVVGAMWQIPDEPRDAGWKFTQSFYTKLLEEKPIGEALRHSRIFARKKKWGPMVWGPYVLYGDPNLTLLADAPADKKEGKDEPKNQEDMQQADSADSNGLPEAEEASNPLSDRVSKASSPLDTSARRIFFTALNEMKQLNQNWLSSLHLLIGLCKGGIEVFEQELSAKQSNVELVAAMARKRAQAMVFHGKSMGISRNVIKAIAVAMERVGGLDKRHITGEDLLAGLLSRGKSEAVRILAELEIRPKDILRHLPQPSTPTTTPFKYDTQTNEAIRYGLRTALNARLGFFGTPHLLIGLIRTGGIQTVTLLRKKGISLEELCNLLLAGMGSGAVSASENGKDIALTYRPRCYKILKRAEALAGKASREAISETDLLQALLEEQEGFTAAVLQKMGAAPGEMLQMLLDGNSGQDKS